MGESLSTIDLVDKCWVKHISSEFECGGVVDVSWWTYFFCVLLYS